MSHVISACNKIITQIIYIYLSSVDFQCSVFKRSDFLFCLGRMAMNKDTALITLGYPGKKRPFFDSLTIQEIR